VIPSPTSANRKGRVERRSALRWRETWKRRTEEHRKKFAVRGSAIRAFRSIWRGLNFRFALCAPRDFSRARHQVPSGAAQFRVEKIDQLIGVTSLGTYRNYANESKFETQHNIMATLLAQQLLHLAEQVLQTRPTHSPRRTEPQIPPQAPTSPLR